VVKLHVESVREQSLEHPLDLLLGSRPWRFGDDIVLCRIQPCRPRDLIISGPVGPPYRGPNAHISHAEAAGRDHNTLPLAALSDLLRMARPDGGNLESRRRPKTVNRIKYRQESAPAYPYHSRVLLRQFAASAIKVPCLLPE